MHRLLGNKCINFTYYTDFHNKTMFKDSYQKQFSKVYHFICENKQNPPSRIPLFSGENIHTLNPSSLLSNLGGSGIHLDFFK